MGCTHAFIGALLCVLAIGAAQASAKPTRHHRPATVLLVTSSELAPSWQRFADWKTRLGKATEVVTVDEVFAGYKGEDIQAKLRACVLHHVAERGTKWVVLGGDSEPDGGGHVPHRVVYQRMFEMAGRAFPGNLLKPGGADLPVDLYYLSPEGKGWDADGDGRYGEWADDRDAIAYTHPAGVSLGRIPVRTAADVRAYTDKVIAYESRYPGNGFARKFMYTNTTDGSEPKVRRSWDDHIARAWRGGRVLRFFHTSTPWDRHGEADYALNARHFLDQINGRAASKLHMHGHGMPQFWVLEHATGHSVVHRGVVGRMTNRDAYLVMTTVSCFTGQFDTAGDPCIVESILRAPRRGAVLAVAPSRSGVPVFHDPRRDFPLMVREGKLDGTTETMTRFWVNGLGPREGGRYLTAGEAFALAKAQMTGHARKTEGYHALQCELNLLGDPTLSLRAVEPTTPTVDAPKAIKIGKQTIGVTTLPGATVCLSKGDEVYAVARADEKGKASLAIAPTTVGPMSLVVSGANLNAVARRVVVE